jgi:hypothetical protein
MQAITQLEQSYHLMKSGGGDYRECIRWARERLREEEDGNDEQIVMLATASEFTETMTLAENLIERYSGYQALDPQLAAGKYMVALRHDYLRGNEDVRSLDSKLTHLYERLQFPTWLSVLVRNCRYAKVIDEYRDLFEREFAYLARIWAVSNSRSQFQARYNHAVSVRHDGL